MTIAATQVYRIRAGGSNANGGGYDNAISGVLATTLNGAIASGNTSITVASATGWPSSGNFYARIGTVGPEVFSSGAAGSSEVVLVTAGQGTATWTVTRAQLGTSALAFASGVVVDNDLSRCDTAPWSATDGTSTASTTFTSATAAFNPTVVGNSLWIASGTGATVGVYTITGYTNATTITLDRASGTMTAAVFKIGGAWADPKVNCESATYVKPGNIIYARAGGSGSSSTPDYTLSAASVVLATGSVAAGYVRFIGENGRPYFRAVSGSNACFGNSTMSYYENIAAQANGGTGGVVMSGNVIINCIGDQNGKDIVAIGAVVVAINCEIYSSAGVSGGSLYGLTASGFLGTQLLSCIAHNCVGGGISMSVAGQVDGCVSIKNSGNGLYITSSSGFVTGARNNTVDGNGGHGIVIDAPNEQAYAIIAGNIISNHTTAGKYAIYSFSAVTANNDRTRAFIDNNTFYNNTALANALTINNGLVSGHMNSNNLGVDPNFANTTAQDYTVGTSLQGTGFPQASLSQMGGSGRATMRNWSVPGALTPLMPTTVIINSRTTAHARR